MKKREDIGAEEEKDLKQGHTTQTAMVEYQSNAQKIGILFWLVILNLLGLAMSLGELYLTYWSTTPDNDLDIINIIIGIIMLIAGIFFFTVVWNAPIKGTGKKKVYHKLQNPTNLHVSEERKQKEINHQQQINSFDRKFSKD